MSDSERIKSSNLGAIEAIIQEFSISIAKEFRIKPHQYRISLVSDSKDEVHVIAGPVVQIVLQWPIVQPMLKSILRRNFNFIKNNGMLHSMELQPYSYVLNSQTNYRGWLRKNWGEVADVLLDLLPKRRVKYNRKVIIEAVDKETGIVAEVRDNTGVRSEWDMKTEARSKLSRIVREFEDNRSQEQIHANPNTSTCTTLVPMKYYQDARVALLSVGFTIITNGEFTPDMLGVKLTRMEMMDN